MQNKLLVLACIFGVTAVLSSSPPGQDVPVFVPLSFDCSSRRLAVEFSQHAQLGPRGASLGPVIDALKLGSLCNQTESPFTSVSGAPNYPIMKKEKKRHREFECGDGCFIVDALAGHDVTTTSGRPDDPFQTISAALRAATAWQQQQLQPQRHLGKKSSRTTISSASPGPRVLLRQTAPHYVAYGSPLVIGPELSGLTLSAAESDDNGTNLGDTTTTSTAPIVSGGVPLKGLDWSKSPNSTNNVWTTTIPPSLAAQLAPNGIVGLRWWDGGERVVRARHPNANPERNG